LTREDIRTPWSSRRPAQRRHCIDSGVALLELPVPACRRLFALIATLALALGTGAASCAPAADAASASTGQANRLDQILAHGVLRVGTTGDYKPFSVRTGNGSSFVGLDIALAADLARTLGVRLEIVPTTWTTLMADFGDGRFDVAMGGISVSMERQKKAYFSIPYLRDGKTPIARCADAAKYATLADIDKPDVRLIVNPGGTNERFARAQAPHAKLIVHPDNVTIFERIIAGDADVMITDAIETRLQQRLHPQLCALHPDAPFDFSEKAVLLPRDEVLKAYVDQWLHQAIESGAFARANEQWLAYPWGIESLRALIDARLLLAPDVAQYKWNHHLAIEDLPREAQVIASLGRQAGALGVPQPYAEAFFRAQIEASKIAQNELFQGWDVFKRGQFPDAPDLATATRPRLDKLTDQLLHALADNWPVLSDPKRRDDVLRAMRPMQAEDISAKAVSEALAPLGAVR
jgi:chorismate mutase-like protein